MVAALAAPQVAPAHQATVRDGDDSPGLLDIRSVQTGHAGRAVMHTVTTHGTWATGLLGASTPHLFALELDTGGSARPERIVYVVSANGRVQAPVLTMRGRFLGLARASRPNARSVKVTLSRRMLGNPASYRWRAVSYYEAGGSCARGCVDRAPNRARPLHDLRAPSVAFPVPGVPADTTYEVAFTVADAGGSGLARWRLERRALGRSAWTLAASGRAGGPNTASIASAEDADDELRVVAFDRHGNRRVSPTRLVSVPIDDTTLASTCVLGGEWEAGTSPDAFRSTLLLSFDNVPPYGALGCTFSGRYVAVVGPTGANAPGSILGVSIGIDRDEVLQGAMATGHRQVIFSRTFPNAAPRTILIEVDASATGPAKIDGLIVR